MMVVYRALSVAHVDVGGLRQRSEHLVRGMRGKNCRSVVHCGVTTHREMVLVHWVEARVTVPCLVEVDTVAGFLEQRLRAHGVVAQAVIGAVGKHRVHWFLI